MTINDIALAPPDVSALVVGIESYRDPGASRGLQGSVLLAARFAQWLNEQGVCRPERITFMAAYEPASYQDEASSGLLALEKLLAELREARIKVLRKARTDEEFEDWITGARGPKDDDKLFTLFWIGHGFSFSDDPAERLFLLDSGAGTDRPTNVELTDLLLEVGHAAPDADVVAFVNACRAPGDADWQRRLERAQQRLTAHQAGEPRPRSQSVVYAAAHGETTRMVGNPNTTFAAELLKRLEELPPGAGPRALFDEALELLVAGLHRDQVGLYWTRFGCWHPGGKLILKPPPEDHDLTHEEWRNLMQEAEVIDGAYETEQRVRWGAFCHVFGLDGPGHRPERLDSVKDLILALRDLPPRGKDRKDRGKNLAPPLVIACDYLAQLPKADAQPRLRQWCEDWSSRRGPDGDRRLDRAGADRPSRLPDRPYLSIEVEHVPGPTVPGRRPVKRYRVRPFLWTDNGPDWLDWSDPVPRDEIVSKTLDAIDEAVARDGVPRPRDLLVEFVLPDRLLGWWPEYEERLGLRHAVVIRARDSKSWARRTAANTMRSLPDHAPAEGTRLSDRIAWFVCDEPNEPTEDNIEVAVDKNFCVVLGRKNGYPPGYGDDGDPPWELAKSIEAGAAIVVSMQQKINCDPQRHTLLLSSGGIGYNCYIPEGRQLITWSIDEADNWRSLRRELPYIIRGIRQDLTKIKHTELKIGLLMEEPDRLWSGYFELKSGYRPGSN